MTQLPKLMRGTTWPYPTERAMIRLLVETGQVRWAGWLSPRNLRRAWDKQNAEFFMNKSSAQFQKKWYLDGLTTHRDLVQ